MAWDLEAWSEMLGMPHLHVETLQVLSGCDHGPLSGVSWSHVPGQESGWGQIQMPIVLSEFPGLLNLLNLPSFSVW